MDEFLIRANAGVPYDSGNIPAIPGERARYRVIGASVSLAAALIIALIITGIWRAQLKSVRKSDFAGAYIRKDSMVLTASRDIFLHRRVTKTKRSSDSGGKGGGSFNSSSGRSFSGRKGRF